MTENVCVWVPPRPLGEPTRSTQVWTHRKQHGHLAICHISVRPFASCTHKCGLTAKDMVILRSDDMAPEGADAMLVTLGRGLESSRMATLPLLLLDANTLEPGGAPYCAAAAFRTATASC